MSKQDRLEVLYTDYYAITDEEFDIDQPVLRYLKNVRDVTADTTTFTICMINGDVIMINKDQFIWARSMEDNLTAEEINAGVATAKRKNVLHSPETGYAMRINKGDMDFLNQITAYEFVQAWNKIALEEVKNDNQ